jgi:two-component system, sensor histidine kinase PdtaS
MEPLLRMLPARPQPLAIRYGVTSVLVGLCFLTLMGLQGRSGFLAFYLLFPAIFAASVLFDRGSGVFATLVSAVLVYLLMKPSDSFLLPGDVAVSLVGFIVVALGVAIVSEGLRMAWERAAAAEQTKDLLLRELGHRTQNNLALVASVLSLQARTKESSEARSALEKAVTRVQAIARAHEHFQPFRQNGRVEMRPYLEKLCIHLGDSLRDVRPIAVNVEADDVLLPTEQAVPIGLIVNELVTNALKHAFPDDRSGKVRIVLKRGSSLHLLVEDNGVGCPLHKNERLGSRLTRLLAEQLGTKLAWEEASPGCRVRIEFSSP